MVEDLSERNATEEPSPAAQAQDGGLPRFGIGALIALTAVQLVCGTILAIDVAVEIHANITAENDESQYGLWHLLPEVFATVLLVFSFALSSRQLLAHRAALRRAGERLDTIRSDFSGLVERRFAQWGLSPAEKEVAMLTLKGLRIAEIARLRGCSEGTIKSHLSAIFRKSQVSSRPEFLARFVDDFLDFSAVN